MMVVLSATSTVTASALKLLFRPTPSVRMGNRADYFRYGRPPITNRGEPGQLTKLLTRESRPQRR
jgi:hypothetical protein